MQIPLFHRRASAVALIMALAMAVALLAALLPATAHVAMAQEAEPHDGDHGDKISAKGLISELPESGGAGSWTIGGKQYTADGDTEFEAENGPLVVGACAEVTVKKATPQIAEKIESKPQGACSGSPGDDDEDDEDYYGRVVSMPTSGLQGEWIVGDRTFQANAETTFEQDAGGFMVGKCVEVYFNASAPQVATKIESQPDYKCNGHDDDDDGDDEWEGKLYGAITALPSTPDLLGDWTVGTFTFVVTSTTELEAKGGVFAVGSLIKVEFYVDNDRTIAKEIKLIYAHDDDDDDSHHGRRGHAWGRVESFPAELVGIWTIGGVEYEATDQTRFKQNNGPFAVDARVMVKFYRMADGKRVAWEIKSTNGNGDVRSDNEFKFVGFVTATPAGSLIGPWEIGGETFIANAQTEFDEDDGVPVVGSYVEVEYRMEGGQRIALEIETETPPGGGADDSVGIIQSGGEESANAAAIADNNSAGVWRIGGVDYLVTTSTELDSMGGPLTVGSTAMVNSFANAQGQKVATRVAGVVFSSFVYVPVAMAR
jgi:hypothetical protein